MEISKHSKNKKDKKDKEPSSKNYNESNNHTFNRDISAHKNPDKYRAKIDNLNKIDPSLFPDGFKTTVLYENPYIVKIRRFLNTEEIEELLKMGEGKFDRSTIVVDGEMTYSNTRTSETAFITENGQIEKYSDPVENVLKKVCYLTGCKRNQIESLMLVKYNKGEQYYNHHDYFKPEHIEMVDGGGQRLATFFIYLTSLDSDEGGETEFPLIGVKTKPSKGTAVFWWNENSDGKLLTKTLHRGNPVKSDKTKYGVNIWVREKGW